MVHKNYSLCAYSGSLLLFSKVMELSELPQMGRLFNYCLVSLTLKFGGTLKLGASPKKQRNRDL